MEYRPAGRGVLVSFDAEWGGGGASKAGGRGLRRDFANMVGEYLGAKYPDMYIEAFGHGTDATANSLYIEFKGSRGPEKYDMEVKLRLYEFMEHGGYPLHFSNLDVREMELGKVRSLGLEK